METQQHPKKMKFVQVLMSAMVLTAINTNTLEAQSKMGAGLTGSAQLLEEKQSPIISFSPVYNAGKTFVRWLVQNDEKDGIFIVERSADGIAYEALGFKDRVGSSLCVNLFYSYVDEAPTQGQSYYRIMSVGTDQTYSYSDVVRVRTDMQTTNTPSNSASNETEPK
jgi:hypothetical protein